MKFLRNWKHLPNNWEVGPNIIIIAYFMVYINCNFLCWAHFLSFLTRPNLGRPVMSPFSQYRIWQLSTILTNIWRLLRLGHKIFGLITCQLGLGKKNQTFEFFSATSHCSLTFKNPMQVFIAYLCIYLEQVCCNKQ